MSGRIGNIELASGVRVTHFWTYMYASLICIGMISNMNFSQPYILIEHLGIANPGVAGRITGQLTLITEIMNLLLIWPFGILADRIGRRPVIMLGIGMIGLSYALYPWATEVNELMAIRVIFGIGVAVAGFAVLWLLLKQTSFGRAIRAIGDDEEVSKVVGINTTVIIAAVFFIGAMYAALAGILTGHDTAVQPRMGLLLLLKGWIASVVGGIGNLYGAIVGGFVLGVVEQFGIWDLAGEWKDAIAFILLILFLSFWPQGLLPRR